ncbi:MAG: ABC transporter substrate-binding protein [Lachnospiraceae bacterium]|nr:ABC transporter substrate-binding protein [Lachnospiraceae bacterium]
MKIRRKRKNQMLAYQMFASGILILLLCGCADSRGDIQLENQIGYEKEEAAESETIVFVDDLGREVQVCSSPQAAALIGSFADVWLLAGGELTAAANDSWASLSLPLGEQVVNLGSITEPDAEKLIASKPDLVLASVNTDADLELEELLTQAGIPVAYFQVSDFEEYLHMLDICTMLTGRRDLYEEHGLKVQQEIEQVKERIDGSRPKVLFLRASASSVKAKGSRDNVCGEMLAELDCINIADDQDSLLEDLSLEAVIVEDPDYIFVTVQGTDQEAAMDNVEQFLISNPAWNSLTAVKKGQYYVLDKRLYNLKPNARWGEAYQKLADILYPVQ